MTLKAISTFTISALSHEGRGIAKTGGKTVFVDGALPDEDVLAEIIKIRRNYNDAKVINVLNPSPERVAPKCAYFGRCGGCSLQHLDPKTQLQHKQAVLIEQLKHFGKVVPQHIADPLVGPVYEYRHKARLGIKYVAKKGNVLVGFREKRSAYLTEMTSCEVLPKSISDAIPALSKLVGCLSEPSTIPQVEVAHSEGQTAFILRHLNPLSTQDVDHIIAFAKRHEIEWYLQPKGPETIEKLFPKDDHKRLRYVLPEFNCEFFFHPADFTQVNPFINVKMVSQALMWLNPSKHDRVLDLFCGIGNFTLPLAKRAKWVCGIEGSASAIERALENAKHNGVLNVDFAHGNLFEPVTSHAWANASYDLLLLDPPRSGAETVCDAINLWSPKRIVYVSCNPATLARDAGLLVNQHGYNLIQVGVMDMFPQTTHVESMALFER